MQHDDCVVRSSGRGHGLVCVAWNQGLWLRPAAAGDQDGAAHSAPRDQDDGPGL
jgi:hypothetical protein